jgi:hypothetical protein
MSFFVSATLWGDLSEAGSAAKRARDICEFPHRAVAAVGACPGTDRRIRDRVSSQLTFDPLAPAPLPKGARGELMVTEVEREPAGGSPPWSAAAYAAAVVLLAATSKTAKGGPVLLTARKYR